MTRSTLNKLVPCTERRGRVVFSLCLCLLTLLATFAEASAQGDDTAAAPPPSRAVSKDDRLKLDAKVSPKDRTKLALEMMDTHLTAAEKLNSEKNFRPAYGELGVFHGLLGDLTGYLDRTDRRGKKVLDEFKRMEIALRRFGPRIEGIRRDLPFEFDEYVKDLLQDVRDARSKAVEHFFDNSVTGPS